MGGFSNAPGVSADEVLLLDGANTMSGPIVTSDLEIRGTDATPADPSDNFAAVGLDTNLWTEIPVGNGGSSIWAQAGLGFAIATSDQNMSPGVFANAALKSNWTCSTDYDVRIEFDATNSGYNTANISFGMMMVHAADEGDDADFTNYDAASHVCAGFLNDSVPNTHNCSIWWNTSQQFQTLLNTHNGIQLRLVRENDDFAVYYRTATAIGGLPDLDNDSSWLIIGSVKTFSPAREAGRMAIIWAGSGAQTWDVHEFHAESGTFVGVPVSGPLLAFAATSPTSETNPLYEWWDGERNTSELAMRIYKDGVRRELQVGGESYAGSIRLNTNNLNPAQPGYLDMPPGDNGGSFPSNYLWTDEDGQLRIAVGVAPVAGDKTTAGEVVGPPLPVIGAVMKEPTGFETRDDTTFSFDAPSRTFSLVPTGSSFGVYVKGVKFTKSTTDSVVISDTEGVHLIYYTPAGVLTSQLGAPADLLTENAIVAFVYWNATDNQVEAIGDERHGLSMAGITHEYLHETIGARFQEGFTLSVLNPGGSGSLDNDAKVELGDGTFWDEDIKYALTDGNPQDFQPIAQIPVWYRSGASGDWRKVAADDYPMLYDGKPSSYVPANDRAPYNSPDGGGPGIWGLAEVGNNDHFNVYIYATNDENEPIAAVLGQAEYNTQNQALNEDPAGLTLGTLPSLEFKLLWRLTCQTNGGWANTPNVRIRSTTDYRAQQAAGSTFTPTDHSSLSNLQSQDHGAAAIFTDVTDFDGVLDANDTDVQLALETLDDLFVSASVTAGDVFAIPGGYLWVDASGVLRVKTTVPTSDTDGTVVGTQT